MLGKRWPFSIKVAKFCVWEENYRCPLCLWSTCIASQSLACVRNSHVGNVLMGTSTQKMSMNVLFLGITTFQCWHIFKKTGADAEIWHKETGDNNWRATVAGQELNWAKHKFYFLFPGYRSEVTGLGLADTRPLNRLSGHIFCLVEKIIALQHFSFNDV